MKFQSTKLTGGTMNEQAEREQLTETSPELLGALSKTLGPIFGQESLMVEVLNTGGGCMVAAVDLSQDGRFEGRQVLLTREGANEWLFGLYDFATDPEDEGICVAIRGFWNEPSRPYDPTDPTGFSSNSPDWLASQVAGILQRLGATTLQGA